MRTIPWILLLVLLGALAPNDADAACFCMMMRRPVSTTQQTGIEADPSYSPSSAVFLVRDGTRTVLTIEATYDGPREEVTMVIPIPQSIGRDKVKTVPGSLFRNIDRRTAPKVRHVWPQCRRRRRAPLRMAASADGLGGGGGGSIEEREEEYSIDIEDEWEVDEYDITLLSAEQSTGLLRYLRDQGLGLPDRADEVLRAYIETDHRFVVAKVDPNRAHMLEGKMMLSPIQLEYESENLQVPVRLGTLNSPGEQELLLYVLARDGRYEVANRPAAVAPTDLRVDPEAVGSMAELYAALMDETFRRQPGAVVTEFAHTMGSRVGPHHVHEFGFDNASFATEVAPETGRRPTWTLTRLRHRYHKSLDDDLTLRAASEPLRHTRRWRHPEANVWAPRGQSGFHVQFIVEHPLGCPSAAMQRGLARRWATTESLWETSGTLWPGQVLLDPVPALGIEPGTAAPSDWGERAAATVAARTADKVAHAAGGDQADAPTPTPTPTNPAQAPTQPSPPAQPAVPPVPDSAADEGGLCTAGGRSPAGALVLLSTLALALIRRRSRATGRGSAAGPRRSARRDRR